MTEKFGIVIGLVSFLGFSVFCTWHHAMLPGMRHPDAIAPSAASAHSPFPSAALPSSPTVTEAPSTPALAPGAVTDLPSTPAPAPGTITDAPSTPAPPAETVTPVPAPPPLPAGPQNSEETTQPSVPHILLGKVVEFYADSDILTPKGRKTLDTILAEIRGSTRVEIAGHTDNLGSEDYNLVLSQRRAEAVRQYFLSRGIAEAHLFIQAYGSSLPIADNATPEGRQRNRRAEVIVHPSSLGS